MCQCLHSQQCLLQVLTPPMLCRKEVLTSAGFPVSWLPARFHQWEVLEGDWEVGGEEKPVYLLSCFSDSSGISQCSCSSCHLNPLWIQLLTSIEPGLQEHPSSPQFRDLQSPALTNLYNVSLPSGFSALPSPIKPILYIDFSYLNS